MGGAGQPGVEVRGQAVGGRHIKPCSRQHHDPCGAGFGIARRQRLAGERGVAVSLTTTTEAVTWRNTVRVHLSLTDGSQITVGGTVTGPRSVQRLVEIDGFEIDVPVSEHVAFLRYTDRPGVVGTAGRLLGEAGVNIAGMQVGRHLPRRGGDAIMVLNVDDVVPPAALEELKEIPGITTAYVVSLPQPAPQPQLVGSGSGGRR